MARQLLGFRAAPYGDDSSDLDPKDNNIWIDVDRIEAVRAVNSRESLVVMTGSDEPYVILEPAQSVLDTLLQAGLCSQG